MKGIEKPPAEYARYAEQIDSRLGAYLREQSHGQLLSEPLSYTALSGGKRLRAILLCLAAEAGGLSGQDVIDGACAVELFHSASLMVDDLPCMDNASVRRWRKAAHLVFGEASTILASFGLVTMGYDLVADNARALMLDGAAVADILQRTSEGILEVINGQSLDLHMDVDANATQESLELCYRQKAGAVLALALGMGARLATAPRARVQALEATGYELGIAFQLVDDLFDGLAASELGGKSTPSERRRTYATICGVECTAGRASELAGAARRRIASLGNAAAPIAALIDWIIDSRLARLQSAHASQMIALLESRGA